MELEPHRALPFLKTWWLSRGPLRSLTRLQCFGGWKSQVRCQTAGWNSSTPRAGGTHQACALIKLFHGDDRGELETGECAPDNRASSSAACLSSRRQWTVKRVHIREQALLLLAPTPLLLLLLLLHKSLLTSNTGCHVPNVNLLKQKVTPSKQGVTCCIHYSREGHEMTGEESGTSEPVGFYLGH